MITVRSVGVDSADALALWQEQAEDLGARYERPGLVLETEFPALIASLVAYGADGEPVGAIVVQWSSQHSPGTAELKRLWVRPEFRGRGYSRVVLGAAEAAARRAGATSIVLESGHRQPEANGLYESSGYGRITPYGRWAAYGNVHCWGRSLPTRVLVLNGAVGAGKTAVAAGALDVLSVRGARVGFIDVDAVAQAQPPADEDPFNDALAFEALTAVAPVYRARGLGLMVLARVVEDPADRDRYAAAFRSDAGAGDVSIVRIEAPQSVRHGRLAVREPEGRWREFAVTRSDELDGSLREEDLDDAVFDNDGSRPAADVSVDVLDAVGW